MISHHAHRALRAAVSSLHEISGLHYQFYNSPLAACHELTAVYMRIAADLVEAREEFDLLKGFESHGFYLTDQSDQIVSLVLCSHDADTNTLVIDFGWTHPGVRRLGLFRKLIDIVVACMWESKSVARVRSSPPVRDDSYDAALAALGFKPVSMVSEYRPYN